jgi:hypothetical protein
MQTKSLSFTELIHKKIKDDNGKVLPESVTSGNVVWFTPDPEEGKGRLLQSNRNTAMARNFSCGYYIVLCGDGFSPIVTTWEVAQIASFASVNGVSCTAWGPNMCSGDQWGSGGGTGYSWSSSNPGVCLHLRFIDWFRR